MELKLFLLVFILLRIRISLQQQMSSEDINDILDKLIRQANGTIANFNGENSDIPESYFLTPVESDTEAGTPQTGLFDSEEKPHMRAGPAYGEEDTLPSGEIDNNFNMLKEMFQKNVQKKPTIKPSPYGQIPRKPLNLLHDYPEIVIDHISYNSDDKDGKAQLNSTKALQDRQPDFVKEISKNFKGPFESAPKSSSSPQITQRNLQENLEPQIKTNVNGLVESVVQGKIILDGLVNYINDGEPNKQDILLQKILDRLPASNPEQNMPNIESRTVAPYPVELNSVVARELDGMRLLSNYLQNLQRNTFSRLSTTYTQAPWLTQKRVPIAPYLGRGLLGLSGPDTLKRTHLVTSLVRSVSPRYIYRPPRPAYYGLY